MGQHWSATRHPLYRTYRIKMPRHPLEYSVTCSSLAGHADVVDTAMPQGSVRDRCFRHVEAQQSVLFSSTE
jgi:hypothetical protein